MTIVRAKELVKALRQVDESAAGDLFSHFAEFFDIQGEQITMFAILCGYPIAAQVDLLKDKSE